MQLRYLRKTNYSMRTNFSSVVQVRELQSYATD